MIPRGYKVWGKEEIGSCVFSLYSLIKQTSGRPEAQVYGTFTPTCKVFVTS